MPPRGVSRLLLGAFAALLALAVATPWTVAATAAPRPNAWFGLWGQAGTTVAARCALGGAAGADVASGVWVGVGGHRYLDIVQVGAIATPTGRRFFAAWGRGVPNESGALYVQRDLGSADPDVHSYAITLRAAAWQLSIDGRRVLAVPDAFRDWPAVATEAMAESEGAGDLLGGTARDPVRCTADRGGPWTIRAAGTQAVHASSRVTASSFAVWHSDDPRP